MKLWLDLWMHPKAFIFLAGLFSQVTLIVLDVISSTGKSHSLSSEVR
jgi:hypothetical protein